MDEPYGITKEHNMIFNEASKRYFTQRPKDDTPDEHDYDDIIQEIKTLNAMPTFPNTQPLNLGKDELPIGFDSQHRLHTVDIAQYPNMLIYGGTGSGRTIYDSWIASSLANEPDDWLVCVYDAFDDGIITNWPWIRDFRPRNIGLTDNIYRDLNRIDHELALRKTIPDADREQLPRILLIIDLNDSCDDYQLMEAISHLMYTYQDEKLSVIITAQRPNAKLIPGEFRKLFHNNVYLGFVNPTTSGFDQYFPETIRRQLPRKIGLVSHTSAAGYEAAMIPNLSRKSLERTLNGHCWQ
jgi:hypothetical protein